MNLAKNISWYTISALFVSGVPFLLLPVFTQYLSPTDYGQMSTIAAYVALLSPVIMLGMPALFSTDFYRLDQSELRRKSFVLLGLPFGLGVVLFVAFWLLKDYLAVALDTPVAWVPVIPILALLSFIPHWTSVMLRMTDRPKYFAVFQGSQAVLLIATAVIFIVMLDMHWEGRLWSMLVAGLLASIVGLLALRPYLLIATPRQNDVREALKFGAGLLPHSVFGQLIRQSDRLFIVHFIGLAAAGEYAVGWQVASIMLVLLSSFNQAWTPYLFQRLSQADEQGKRSIVKLSYQIALGFVALFLIINLAAPLIFSTMISAKYHDAQRFVPFITLGYLFVGFYLLVTDYIFYTKKTYLFSIMTTANGVINLALNYVCVQQFGAIGVTYAFAASSLLAFVAAWILAHKVYPMPWMGDLTPSLRI